MNLTDLRQLGKRLVAETEAAMTESAGFDLKPTEVTVLTALFANGKLSIGDIAKHAGLSRPLLYRKFANKEAIFSAVYDAVFLAQFDKALPNNHTLATVLKAAGYHTIVIGRVISMGLGDGAPLLWYSGQYHELPALTP